jgi:hypothetical protein
VESYFRRETEKARELYQQVSGTARMMFLETSSSSTPQCHRAEMLVWMFRTVFDESVIAPRGAAVWDRDIFVLQPEENSIIWPRVISVNGGSSLI